jgi:hypothetical protein
MKRKAKELAMKLYEETHAKFPEIILQRIQAHPEQSDRFWIQVEANMNAQQQRQMHKFTDERATEILIEEGFSFAFMLKNAVPISSARAVQHNI